VKLSNAKKQRQRSKGRAIEEKIDRRKIKEKDRRE
jgi:hypothetical protein